MRIAVVGAGVGGLAAAVRLAALGPPGDRLERADAPGGKAGRRELAALRLRHGTLAADHAVGVPRAVRRHRRAAATRSSS